MVQPTELEIKVSQLPCLKVWFHVPENAPKIHPEKCDCQGTNLRYPMLSREKEIMVADPGSVDGTGNAIIRVPDVTLEKVLKEISKLGSFQLHCIGGRNGFRDTYWIVLENKTYQDYAKPIPAACAALIDGGL